MSLLETSSGREALRSHGGAVAFVSLLAVAVGLTVVHARLVHGICDDAYIAFRYARNLVEGHGLVYNPGERVEGFTSPSWVFLIAGGMRLGLSPEFVTLVLGVLSLTGIAAALARLTRLATGSWWTAAVSLLLLASLGPVVTWAFSGMETAAFTALVLSSLCLYHAAERRELTGTTSSARSNFSRFAAAGAGYGLSTLTRPEGALFLVVAVAHLCGCSAIERSRRTSPWPKLGGLLTGSAVLVIPLLLWRRNYYGDWLPNTYYAKIGAANAWDLGIQYLRSFGTEYPALWVGSFVGIGCAVVRRTDRSRLRLVAHLVLAVLAYGLSVARVGGDYMALHRMLVPVMPIGASFCARAVTELLAPAVRRPGLLRPVAAGAGTLLLLGLCAWLMLPSYDSVRGRVPKGTNCLLYMRRNCASWTAIGRTLERTLWPGARIATSVAGALPYHARVHTLDQGGLNDRYTARIESDPWQLHKPGHQRQATIAHLLDQDPPIDLILGLPRCEVRSPRDLPLLPSPAYRACRFAVDGLEDDEGRRLWTFGYLHERRWADAAAHGFLWLEPEPN